MTKERVEALFLLFCDLNDIGNYAPLVENAIAQVQKNLTGENHTAEELENLNMYCAAVAYYRYILLTAGKEAGDISLDGLSIKQNSISQVQIAKQVVEDFLKPIGHLLGSSNFYFTGVGAACSQ